MPTGTKIKEIRKQKGLTQKQLGDLCGMADSAIRRYENGNANPKIETLQKIADALEIPTDYLLDYDIIIENKVLSMDDQIKHQTKRLSRYHNALNPNEEGLVAKFRKLNKIGQSEADKRVEELTEIPRYTKPDD